MALAHVINEKMAKLIHEATGLTVEQIRTMDHEDVQAAMEKHIGHKITEYSLAGALSSGNILIDMGRAITSEEIQRRVDKIGKRRRR